MVRLKTMEDSRMSKTALPVITAVALALSTAAFAQAPTPAPQQPPAQANPMGAQKMTEAQLRTSLQSKGYTQIDKVEAKGADFEVQAKKGTASVKLLVDGATGTVKSETPG
jgi:hypothetical protein